MQDRLLFITGVALLAAGACRKHEVEAKPAPAIKVAAAADLALAFKEVGDAFEKANGAKVVFSFGSTGLLAKQIIEGAPFDVFAAANVSFVDEVVKAGSCDQSTQSLYAIGRIAVWTKKGGPVAAARSLAELTDARFQKIAIANPAHAPYGKAAEEAMKKAGVYDAVKPKLVFGENIQQTLQFAQSENADAAIVSLSLALPTAGGEYALIDDALHAPIRQGLAVCGKRPETEVARKFAAYVISSDGRAIMRRYGFLLPGESIATAD